ncbi:MAG: hypothetical protein ABS34_06875 [Opitutaceae bacterium BACL24 MAG-120322-bin51]|nr:MAG: hypothetical protein ABS34_06875 [Opitutaceae bacterium BACL24 MAG-120322-bin51]
MSFECSKLLKPQPSRFSRYTRIFDGREVEELTFRKVSSNAEGQENGFSVLWCKEKVRILLSAR